MANENDYNFFLDGFWPVNVSDGVTKSAVGKNGKVEFFDIDLDAELPEAVDRLDMVRKKTAAGLEKIESMRTEAIALEIKSDNDFSRAIEMVGQCKKLKKMLEDAVNNHIKPLWDEWKSGKNILTATTSKIDAVQKIPQGKADAYAHEIEMARRKKQQEAEAEARKLQQRLDAEQREREAAERKAAKAEKRKPVYQAPIVVDKPVIEKEVKIKTESAAATIETYLDAEIQNLGSKFVLQMVMNYKRKQYLDLAEKALKAAIKAGVLGINGADGVKVVEKTKTGTRRR